MPHRDASPTRGVHTPPVFPLVPSGWYHVARMASLRTPREVRLGDREFVAFAVDRRAHVLDGRCPHFAAMLWRGSVRDGCLHCPLHGWRFFPDGRCAGTPSGEEPPAAARVRSYPTAVLAGHLFFHTDPGHESAPPFFDAVDPDDLLAAPPFAFEVEMPWWLVSANGFDSQHFLAAHDRRLVGSPALVRSDVVFEARAAFDVIGTGWRDRLTRLVAGPRVEMTVRSVGGGLVLVTSRVRRSVTYGLVSIHPVTASRSRVSTLIWKRAGPKLLRPFDALDVRVRANFIRAFLQPDIEAGEGIRYDRSRSLGADALLNQYLNWLSRPA